MSDGFDIDVASLRRFRTAVERIQERVGDLHGFVEDARLAPGTFTRTEGGQLADTGHTETLDGIGARLDMAVEQLRAVTNAIARTADNYETTDEQHAAAMSDIGKHFDSAWGDLA